MATRTEALLAQVRGQVPSAPPGPESVAPTAIPTATAPDGPTGVATTVTFPQTVSPVQPGPPSRTAALLGQVRAASGVPQPSSLAPQPSLSRNAQLAFERLAITKDILPDITATAAEMAAGASPLSPLASGATGAVTQLMIDLYDGRPVNTELFERMLAQGGIQMSSTFLGNKLFGAVANKLGKAAVGDPLPDFEAVEGFALRLNKMTADWLREGGTPDDEIVTLQRFFFPQEVTDGTMIDMAANVAEGGMFSTQRMVTFREQRETAVRQMTEFLQSTLGEQMSATEAGNFLAGALTHRGDTLRQLASGLWEPLMKQIGNVPIDMRSAKIALTDLDRITKEISTTITQEIVPRQSAILNEFGRPIGLPDEVLEIITKNKALLDPEGMMKILTSAKDLPDTLSMEAAKFWKTQLATIEFSPALSKESRRQAQRAAEKVRTAITRAQESSLKSADALNGTNNFRAFKAANSATEAVKDFAQTPHVAAALKAVDEKNKAHIVMGQYLQRNNEAQLQSLLDQVGKYTKITGDASVEEIVRGAATDNMLLKSYSIEKRLIDADKLFGQITGAAPSSLGKEMMAKIYSPKQLDTLRRFSQVLDLSQKASGSAVGGVGIQLLQFGALVTLQQNPGRSLAILVAPTRFAKWLTDPTYMDWVIKGMQVNPRRFSASSLVLRGFAESAKLEDIKFLSTNEASDLAAGIVTPQDLGFGRNFDSWEERQGEFEVFGGGGRPVREPTAPIEPESPIAQPDQSPSSQATFPMSTGIEAN